ncbi:MAG: DUF2493 domain-containing protein [Hydrogenophaga sp.]|nr:DUF2493 domain-containing protein [Hydrogenophaga sp.]
MRIIVCGGRDFEHKADVFAALDRLHGQRPVSLLIHGAAPGADLLAEDWARAREIPYFGVPAKWTVDGKAAGPMRNAAMAALKPTAELLVAFPGGRGTANMIDAAETMDIKVWRPYPNRSA